MKYMPYNLILILAILYTTNLKAGCNSPNTNDVTVEITTPTGDPSTTAGANTFNERTYSFGSTPTVDVYCSAKDVPSEDEDYLRWTIEDVGSIKAKWDPHVVGDEYTGKGESSTATYTGLPDNYDEFGKKKITLTLNGGVSASDCKDTTYVEIFFPRDAYNHPNGNALDPNWFYYWSQVYKNANVTYDPNYTSRMKTPGMRDWSYNAAQNKNAIVCGTLLPSSGGQYGSTKIFSGIDFHIAAVIHEEAHVAQIARADATMPATNGSDSFRYGWAWKWTLSHNHYKEGVDKKWGVAGYDDDNNNTMDDAAVQPPFEPGNFDDEDLSHPSWSTWIKGLAFPNPMKHTSPNESEAINAAETAVNENDYAGSDWGHPGKQHKTLNKWDN